LNKFDPIRVSPKSRGSPVNRFVPVRASPKSRGSPVNKFGPVTHWTSPESRESPSSNCNAVKESLTELEETTFPTGPRTRRIISPLNASPASLDSIEEKRSPLAKHKYKHKQHGHHLTHLASPAASEAKGTSPRKFPQHCVSPNHQSLRRPIGWSSEYKSN